MFANRHTEVAECLEGLPALLFRVFHSFCTYATAALAGWEERIMLANRRPGQQAHSCLISSVIQLAARASETAPILRCQGTCNPTCHTEGISYGVSCWLLAAMPRLAQALPEEHLIPRAFAALSGLTLFRWHMG